MTVAIGDLARPALIPLSHAQQGQWFINRLHQGADNVLVISRLVGGLDVEALRAALNDVMARHEVLRTVYPETEEGPFQHILPTRPDLVALSTEVISEQQVPDAVSAAVAHTFDLRTDLPLHAHLLAIGPREHVLNLVIHHVATDGWSISPFCEDLSRAYAARLKGLAPAFAPLPVQYADFAIWQRHVLGETTDPGSLLHRQLTFWRTALADLPEYLTLPADRPRPAAFSYHGRAVDFHLEADLRDRLVDLARTNKATLFMVIQAALAALLTRLGAGSDIPIGTAVASRLDEDLDDLVGFFVNTLVLRTDTSGDPDFTELLARVRATDLAAYDHQDLPFECLVEAINPARTLAYHPLFQVMLVSRDDADAPLDLPGLVVHREYTGPQTTKFDLTLYISDSRSPEGVGIDAALLYNTDLFDHATAQRITRYLTAVLQAAAVSPRQPLSAIEILSAEERHELISGWNDTAHTGYATTVPSLVEANHARR